MLKKDERRDYMIEMTVKHIEAYYGGPIAADMRPLLIDELGTLWDEAQTLTPNGQERLEMAQEIIEATLAYDQQDGSFRAYIYGHLGFGPSAYSPLLTAGGMNYTNESDGSLLP